MKLQLLLFTSLISGCAVSGDPDPQTGEQVSDTQVPSQTAVTVINPSTAPIPIVVARRRHRQQFFGNLLLLSNPDGTLDSHSSPEAVGPAGKRITIERISGTCSFGAGNPPPLLTIELRNAVGLPQSPAVYLPRPSIGATESDYVFNLEVDLDVDPGLKITGYDGASRGSCACSVSLFGEIAD